MKTKKHITLLAALAGLCSISQAADVEWDGGGADTEYLTPENWNTDAVPNATGDAGTTDYPFVGRYFTQSATHSAGSVTADSLQIGFQGGDGTFTMSGAGTTMTVGNTFGFKIGTFNDAVGTFNLEGGSLDIRTGEIGTNTGTGTFNLSGGTLQQGAGSFANINVGSGSGTGTFNLSGGSLSGIRLGLQDATATSNINVIGDAASIDFENWTFGGTTFLNIVANSTGTSLLDVNFWSGDGTENLTVDLSAYTDGFDYGDPLASLDLIENQFATFDASRWDSVSLVGAYGDFVYTNTTFGTMLSIENVIAIPEPSSTALLGLGGLALALRRRR